MHSRTLSWVGRHESAVLRDLKTACSCVPPPTLPTERVIMDAEYDADYCKEFLNTRLRTRCVVAFDNKWFAVPSGYVWLVQQKRNFVDSPEELGKILASEDPDVWRPHLEYGRVHRIRITPRHVSGAVTGIFTSFCVEGHPEEERILRLVPPRVCDEVFSWLTPHYRDFRPANDRQKQRQWVILYWRSRDQVGLDGSDHGAAIDPEACGWPLEEHPGSCAVAPPPPPPGPRELFDQLSAQVRRAMPHLPPDQWGRMHNTLWHLRDQVYWRLELDDSE